MLKTPPAEQILIDAIHAGQHTGVTDDVERMLCTSIGRAQAAVALAERSTRSDVRCMFLDLYAAEESRPVHGDAPPNLSVQCMTDLPDTPAEVVGIPVPAAGEAEWTRDLLQQAHLRLRSRGRLIAAVDNPRDQWLHGELQRLFDKVTRRPVSQGVFYAAVKSRPLKKVKNFECRFAFRDRGRLIHAVSRPGVFSHRRLDLGARALIEAVEVHPGERVFEIGCGSGVVSLSAAFRAGGVYVFAVDSNARAVQCTRRGAELNGLHNVAVELRSDARCDEPDSYDVALTNPPYYSRGRLGDLFVRQAVNALKPTGRLYVVTKNAEWYLDRLAVDFETVSLLNRRNYHIVYGEGLKRA